MTNLKTYVVYRVLDSKPVDVIESVRLIRIEHEVYRFFSGQEQYHPRALYPTQSFYVVQEELTE